MLDAVKYLFKNGEFSKTALPTSKPRWMITLETETRVRSTHEMCSKDELDALFRNLVDFKEENPSSYYKIAGKIGSGGYAKVFLVDQIKDRVPTGKRFALKFFDEARPGGEN